VPIIIEIYSATEYFFVIEFSDETDFLVNTLKELKVNIKLTKATI
jgi:hypothetical protein